MEENGKGRGVGEEDVNTKEERKKGGYKRKRKGKTNLRDCVFCCYLCVCVSSQLHCIIAFLQCFGDSGGISLPPMFLPISVPSLAVSDAFSFFHIFSAPSSPFPPFLSLAYLTLADQDPF